MVVTIKDHSLMIFFMEQEYLFQGTLDMKAHSQMVKRMVMECNHGIMDKLTVVLGWIIICMDKGIFFS